MIARALGCAVVVLALVSGCGVGEQASSTVTDTVTATEIATEVRTVTVQVTEAAEATAAPSSAVFSSFRPGTSHAHSIERHAHFAATS